MTIRNTPLTEEELAFYHAKCDAVAYKLYSLDFHYAPWEEASEKERLKYRNKAHLARVWWNFEVNQF
jgi:hypothetical protein